MSQMLHVSNMQIPGKPLINKKYSCRTNNDINMKLDQ